MNNVTLSFICATNDKKTLNEMLISSLKKQNNQDFELILVDAKELGFKSAAETLNYGASLANGKYLCFAHQDIEFIDKDAIDTIIKYFNTYDFGIAGVACQLGSNKKNYKIVSSVVQNSNGNHVGEIMTNVAEGYAVDECLMFIKKENFVKFDNYGNTWHLYGVEYCLRCQIDHKKILYFPINIHHKSNGFTDNNYWKTLRLVGKRHKNIKVINTVFSNFKNDFTLALRCFAHKILNNLKITRREE